MGLSEKIRTDTELTITGVPEELARVCCRMRKNPQQPCDGSCPPCRLNFANYIEVESEKLIKTSTLQPSGYGPDEEPLMSKEEYREVLKKRIKNWIATKKGIISKQRVAIDQSSTLNDRVARRIAFLEQLASIPDDIIDQSMSIPQ
ncbi:hypothetical protein K2X92_01580 [Candidatus Gracilibacteria bacterium]|nr:hypothetical protein [Candidatus Gracilibacteria bacterium]